MVIALLGSIVSFAEAKLEAPFDYQTSGVEIIDYKLDFKDIEIILDVDAESPGMMEISFERDFFDSTFQGNDEEFTILADGDLVHYDEIQATPQIRTLKFNISPDTDLVEIFGSKLFGFSSQPTPIVEVEVPVIVEDQSEKMDQLLAENEKLKKENKLLQQDNAELDKRIFELENLVSALETEVNKLKALVTEQVKVIYNWVLGNGLN